MNIYFSFSLSQSDKTVRNHFNEIISVLKNAGHTVLPANILEKIDNKDFASQQTAREKELNRKNLIKCKNSADIIILETSLPSIGIGQELQYAVSINKPVLAIYNNNYTSNVLEPYNYEKFLLLEYHQSNIRENIETGIEYLQKTTPARFNLMLDPNLLNFIKETSKSTNTTSAAYIRQLITKEMNRV